jgi:hypothetical protein
MINPSDVDLFHVVDTPEEAVQIVADRADAMRSGYVFAAEGEEPVEA